VSSIELPKFSYGNLEQSKRYGVVGIVLEDLPQEHGSLTIGVLFADDNSISDGSCAVARGSHSRCSVSRRK
jgi:hypothetical protein